MKTTKLTFKQSREFNKEFNELRVCNDDYTNGPLYMIPTMRIDYCPINECWNKFVEEKLRSIDEAQKFPAQKHPSNTGKVKQIKQSWFGNWAHSVTHRSNDELLMFHLTDDATIIAQMVNSSVERTKEMTVKEFERHFDISIAELLNK